MKKTAFHKHIEATTTIKDTKKTMKDNKNHRVYFDCIGLGQRTFVCYTC